MLIAQFSDTHIKPAGQLAYGVADTHQMLQSALAHLLTLPQTMMQRAQFSMAQRSWQ